MMPNERQDHVSLLLDERLTHISLTHFECCIYKVPEWLRRQNERAYEPEMLAIGPYHRGKGSLRMMEEHKLRYLQQLLKRRKETSVDRYVTAMRDLKERAYGSYADAVSFNEDEFVEMMLLDSCFIVELFRKFTITSMRDTQDTLFKMDWILHTIWRDLMCFENQLPFFVLVQFFNMTKVPDPRDDFVDLVMRYCDWLLKYYFYSLPVPGGYSNASSQVSTQDTKHFLGLVLQITCSSFVNAMSRKGVGDEKKRWENIRCATELHEAGIKFAMTKKETPFDIRFENGVLEIGLVVVHEKTEVLCRNQIAYEQHLQDDNAKCVIRDCCTFLCCLINSPKDVSLLRRCGILRNMLGDDEAVCAVFSSISTCVFASRDSFCYTQVFNDVNEHCRRRWNIWMAKLWRNYFNSPWTIISFLGVIVLLLLTFTQTLISILPYLTHRLCS